MNNNIRCFFFTAAAAVSAAIQTVRQRGKRLRCYTQVSVPYFISTDSNLQSSTHEFYVQKGNCLRLIVCDMDKLTQIRSFNWQ